MSSSLQSGVSGLRAHQTMLDVVGNNLANLNTPGFKGGRATFADMMSETVRGGTGPTDTLGGTNPVQVGLGTRLASIDQNMNQGSFQGTERTLDLAIEGEGYFVLSDGRQRLFSRVGSFDLDAQHFLVNPSNGMRVQSAAGTDINIDVDAALPARATTSLVMRGNLDARAAAPSPTVLSSQSAFRSGTRATLTGGAVQPFALANGMQLSIATDGQPAQTVTFTTADFAAIGAATAAEVAAVINAQTTGLTATAAGGALTITSDRAGGASSLDVNDGTGSPAALLGISTTITTGTEVAATPATLLNDLPQTLPAHQPGDRINIAGTDADGTPVSATFVFGAGPGQNGVTVGDLTAFISGLYPASTVALAADGTLSVTADADGESPLQLVMTDDPSNVGFTSFSSLAMDKTEVGSSGATVQTALEVYDTQGGAHTVQFTYHKTGDNEWEITATLPDQDGVVIDGAVRQIRFLEDGGFDVVAGVGAGDARISFQFDGFTGSQDITLDLGTSGSFAGLTQFGGSSTASAASQDGYASGTLSSLSIDPDGKIQGIYTNGQASELATLGLATFTNPAGLVKIGDSLLAVSTSSGPATFGQALAGRAGKVLGGGLEGSNVDVAVEFTRLITAQRGFQVNARTITTTDEMLQELANLVR